MMQGDNKQKQGNDKNKKDDEKLLVPVVLVQYGRIMYSTVRWFLTTNSHQQKHENDHLIF